MRTRTLFAVCFLLVTGVSFSISSGAKLTWPQIATNSNGESVAVWSEILGCEEEVFAQRYDSQRNPIGEKLWVSENNLKYNIGPLVGISDSGGFVVVWSATSVYDSDDWYDRDFDVYARLYDSSGVPNDIIRITYTPEHRHEANAQRVVMIPSGNFAICWMDWYVIAVGSGSSYDNMNIYTQQFALDGTHLSEPRCITDSPLNYPLKDIIQGMIATEQEITVVYRGNDRQLKTVIQYWLDIKPNVTLRYQREENPGDFVSLTISPTIASKKYQVYYCDSLENNCWSPLGEPVIAESNSLTVIDNGGAASSPLRETKSRFYKVSLVP